MKRILILGLLVALLVVAMAVPAFAAGKGYGKQINDSCLGASYGQLVSAAQQSGHIDSANGAKYFVESGALTAHLVLCG
jgi:hypothetical protein